jgi:hypothetical protein
MITKTYNTVHEAINKYDGKPMEFGSFFTEYICEKTGVKLIEEKPVGLMKIMGTIRKVVSKDDIQTGLGEDMFDIVRSMMQ